MGSFQTASLGKTLSPKEVRSLVEDLEASSSGDSQCQGLEVGLSGRKRLRESEVQCSEMGVETEVGEEHALGRTGQQEGSE